MTPEQRRRLKALSPCAEDALPLGGMERGLRVWGATPTDWTEAERLAHVQAVLRMIQRPEEIFV